MQISFYVLIFSLIGLSIQQQEKYHFVLQMLNIGARFPKNISRDWVHNQGELTHIGNRQLYLLGKAMAFRYMINGNFLGQRNLPQEVIIKAAFMNDNITVSSAYAYSRGLYSAGTGQTLTEHNIAHGDPPYKDADFNEFKKELGDAALPNLYETVPIMVEGGGADYLLSAIKYCTGLDKLVQKRVNTESKLRNRRSSLRESAKDAFEAIKKVFKVEIMNLEDSIVYRDYAESAKYYGKAIEADFTDAIKVQLNNIYRFVRFEEYFDEVMVAKVVSNHVLKEAKEALEKGKDVPNGRKKLLSYMVEDQNIFALLKLITDDKIEDIPFSSMLEIRISNQSNEQVARAYFNEKPLIWKSNKKLDLDMKSFNSWLDDNMLEEADFSLLCLEGKEEPKSKNRFWFIIGLLIAPVVIITGILILIYLRRKPKESVSTEETDADIDF